MNFHLFKKYNNYQIGMFLASTSMAFGILREFIIIGLLGFTAKNDMLQIYLSIFYTIGLTIDAMRLSCLNLFSVLTLPHMLLAASVIGFPFAVIIAVVMSYSTGGLSNAILCLTIFGGYLNLIVALLITYKQRNNAYITAQIISVLPNFILIPGIIICFYFSENNLVFSIVFLTCLIPIVQLLLLLAVPNHHQEELKISKISIYLAVLTFARHFSSMIGEQLFQIIARATFFNYGAGYLSVFSMLIRLYSALRYVLIDSYIGSKLTDWKMELQHGDYRLFKMINSTKFSLCVAIVTLSGCLYSTDNFVESSIQMSIMLLFGFYFSTLVRIIYYKINHYENNAALIMRFAIYELIFSGFAFVIAHQFDYPLLALLWVGYIAKPLIQLLLLRRRFYGLAMN